MISYIDIHSHLCFADFGNDLNDVIKRMHEAGVGTITVGTDFRSSQEAVKIAEANEPKIKYLSADSFESFCSWLIAIIR